MSDNQSVSGKTENCWKLSAEKICYADPTRITFGKKYNQIPSEIPQEIMSPNYPINYPIREVEQYPYYRGNYPNNERNAINALDQLRRNIEKEQNDNINENYNSRRLNPNQPYPNKFNYSKDKVNQLEYEPQIIHKNNCPKPWQKL